MTPFILTTFVIVAIVILPGIGVPNCPLLVFAGGFLGHHYGIRMAMGLAIIAVTIHILGAYWIAAYPLRRWLESRVTSTTERLLGMKPRSVLLTTVLLHVTPGVPLCIQTYFPGIHRLTYWKYLGIALPIQSVYTALIVAAGGSTALAPMLIASRASHWVPHIILAATVFWLLPRRRHAVISIQELASANNLHH